MKGLAVELQKSRRRHLFLTAACVALIVLLWTTLPGGADEEQREAGYSALFYAIPVMNTVIMPLGTAVLASRIWDVESKEQNCRLLFTFQNRWSLFGGKVLLGFLCILLVCAVEGAGLVAAGRISGYTERLDWWQLWWLTLCTFAVNAMLYFLWLWLSIRFDNQVPTLAAGMVGSLSGLFAAFMPQGVSYFLPWGYYIPLSAMRMDWDRATRITQYIPVSFPIWLLCVTVLLLVFFAVMSWRSLDRKEV